MAITNGYASSPRAIPYLDGEGNVVQNTSYMDVILIVNEDYLSRSPNFSQATSIRQAMPLLPSQATTLYMNDFKRGIIHSQNGLIQLARTKCATTIRWQILSSHGQLVNASDGDCHALVYIVDLSVRSAQSPGKVGMISEPLNDEVRLLPVFNLAWQYDNDEQLISSGREIKFFENKEDRLDYMGINWRTIYNMIDYPPGAGNAPEAFWYVVKIIFAVSNMGNSAQEIRYFSTEYNLTSVG
ncbi:hypothetical protein [Serratia bockelmannii]|uniref:hypothetical protein n=1 Tax=Serratia bockelmannii TaxID=2703793 RepID=UPI003FA70E59